VGDINKAHDSLIDANILLTIGSNTVVVNGANQVMDTTAVVTNSRTMVPIRFISEYLGATVKWESTANVSHIFTNPTF